ncbi:putative inorganic carbon transporter subunit DabA, partial [Thiomonas sp.]
VDNEHFGSGSKAYHNVAGRFGVVTGNLSDLRTGLPAQSVLKDGRPYHEPIRLLAIVEAPAAFTLEVAGRLPKVMSLITNGWITVVVVDPETGDRLFYDRGEWYNLNDDPQYSPSVKPLLEEELSA